MRYGVMVMELYDKHFASSLCVLSLFPFFFPSTRGHLFNRDQSIFGTASDWAGKKRIPPYTTTSTLSDLIYIVFFSHWMTVPYDYHHHLLLRAGSQHSAKKIPPYHTIPHHTTLSHTAKRRFHFFVYTLGTDGRLSGPFFASIPKPVLSFSRQPFFVCRSGAHSMPTINQSINQSIHQSNRPLFFFLCFFFLLFYNYIFVERRVGAGSREHVGLWITLASMDGWMDGCMAWLGMGISSFFFLLFL